MEILSLLIMMVTTWLYTLTKTHPTLNGKFTVCKPNLSKPNFKKNGKIQVSACYSTKIKLFLQANKNTTSVPFSFLPALCWESSNMFLFLGLNLLPFTTSTSTSGLNSSLHLLQSREVMVVELCSLTWLGRTITC